MPKNFTTIKKYLSYEEKLLDFIEDYAIDIPDFEYVYLDDPNYKELTPEQEAYNDDLYEQMDQALDDDDFDLYEELSNKLIDYPERKIDIEKTFDLLPDFEKREALIYAENNLFKETIILKCMNCDYEEEVDYEIVEECWMDGPYPISYCPHCNVGDFVPLDIYNKKKLKWF